MLGGLHGVEVALALTNGGRTAASDAVEEVGVMLHKGGQLAPLLGDEKLKLLARFHRRQRVEPELEVLRGHLKGEVMCDHQHVDGKL